MPYTTIDDLPTAVKHVLPLGAQEIYLAAFNHAWEEYQDPQKRRAPSDSQETVAREVAWAAVEKIYIKTDQGWEKKA